MNEQIIKVESDTKDQGCLKITLRQSPNAFIFWKKNSSQLVTYKGYGKNWYCIPSFKPAPNRIIPLLKQISQGSQFRHLRAKLN